MKKRRQLQNTNLTENSDLMFGYNSENLYYRDLKIFPNNYTFSIY